MFESLRHPIKTVQAYARAIQGIREIIKGHPLGQLAVMRGNEGRQPKPLEMDTDLKAAQIDVWVATAVGTIARNLSEAPPLVEEFRRIAGKDQWVPAESGALVELIARPNPVEPMLALDWKTTLSLLLHGNGYLIPDLEANELWHTRSDWFTVLGGEDGRVTGYEVKNHRGQKQTLGPEEVVHFKFPNPIDPWYGLSPVKPIRSSILVDVFYERYVQNFFENGAIPSGLLYSDQPHNQTRSDKARVEWDKVHKGVKRSWKTAFMGGGWKYQQISPPLKDLAVEVLTRVTRERILAGFGLPPVLAGVFEYANYANSREQIKIFYLNTVGPIIRVLDATYNLSLVPLFQGRDPQRNRLRIRHQTEKILALQEDEDGKASRSVKIYRGGVATLNEARKVMDLEPRDDGDELYTPPAGVMVGGPTGGTKLIGAPTLRLDDNPDRPVWASFIRSAVGIERKLQDFWLDFLDEQLARIIDNVYNTSGKGASINLILARCQLKDSDFLPTNIDLIFNPDKEWETLREVLGPLNFEVSQEAGQDALNRFGIDLQFDVRVPVAQDFINGMTNKVRQVSDHTWEKIKDLLVRGEQEGWSVKTLVDRLRDEPTLFGVDRARAIVRTEGTTIANGSAGVAWAQAGVPGKRWITSIDNVARHHHVVVNGQYRDIAHAFDVGGEKLDYPGDYRARANNRINCRCTMAPVEDESEDLQDAENED